MPSPAHQASSPGLVRENKEFLEKYRNVFWIIIFLIGIICLILGYFLQKGENNSKVAGDILEKVGEFLTFAVSLHALYEIFTKTAERRILQLELNDIVAPQKEKLEILQGNVTELERNIKVLDEHTRAVFNLVRYKSPEFFEAKWKFLAHHYENLYIIGDFSHSFIVLIRDSLQNPRRKLSIFLSANGQNNAEVLKFVEFSKDMTSDVNIFHVDRLERGFLAFGMDSQLSNGEALLNHLPSSEHTMSGYHIMGEAAMELFKSLGSLVILPSLDTENNTTAFPIKITSSEILQTILERRRSYNSEINNLRKGLPLKGEAKICQQMMKVLAQTKLDLKVTHLAKGDSIKLLENKIFQEWLQENFNARKRGVSICRIFLLEEAEVDNEIIRRVAKQLKDNGITVKYVVLDYTDKSLFEDFSIYDDKYLVYINKSGKGPWRGSENDAEARYSTDKELIENYKSIYSALSELAKDFAG
jgi:hypothetical protein